MLQTVLPGFCLETFVDEGLSELENDGGPCSNVENRIAVVSRPVRRRAPLPTVQLNQLPTN
jgi:hypothetical protein